MAECEEGVLKNFPCIIGRVRMPNIYISYYINPEVTDYYVCLLVCWFVALCALNTAKNVAYPVRVRYGVLMRSCVWYRTVPYRTELYRTVRYRYGTGTGMVMYGTVRYGTVPY